MFRYCYRDVQPTRESASFVAADFTPTENAAAFSSIANLLENTECLGKMDLPGDAVCYEFSSELTKYVVLWHKDDSLLGRRKWPVGLHLGEWWPKQLDMFGRKKTLWPNWMGNVTLWVGEEPIVLSLPSTTEVYPVSPRTWSLKAGRTSDCILVQAEQVDQIDTTW